MIKAPSLRKLEYLVKLHDLQHFGNTAKACFVSQSTLSAGISDLESQIGHLLIERDRQKMTFTPLGESLVTQAKNILHATNTFLEIAEKTTGFFESTLRLGIIPTIAPFVLSQYLAKLHRMFPKLQILIREDLTENLQTQLQAGELDLLILALPYPLDSTIAYSLNIDRLFLIHHAKSQFIMTKKIDSVKQLPDKSILLLEDGHCLRQHTLSTCQHFSSRQINEFSTNSLSSLIQMLRYDIGVSFIPEMAIKNGILDGVNLIVNKGNINNNIQREIGFVWRETSPFEKEFRILATSFQKIL